MGWSYYGTGVSSYSRLLGQLVVSGYWPGVITRSVTDSYTFGVAPTQWTAANGQTLEARVDVINFDENATAARIVVGSPNGFYSVFKGHDFIAVTKWSASLVWGTVTVFSYNKVQVRDANVVLVLALTRADPNVVLTARVLDEGNDNYLLYEGTVVDSPDADHALTGEEFTELSGMQLAVTPDLPGAPFTGGGAAIGLFQYNDGTKGQAEATFDNLELRKYEIPALGLARAVRLSWPAVPGVNYSVDAAPTVQGPWLPVQELGMPGIQQLTVPQTRAAEFFRLRQAP